jgi:hypothetical protein
MMMIVVVIDPDLLLFGMDIIPEWIRQQKVPVVCRWMAVFIAVPFLVIILLDIVAYRESRSFCFYPDPVSSRFASIAISQTLD